jgi:hypothetical protein
MPKLLHARAPRDMAEEQKVRKLANSRHAPADWIMRARMIVRTAGMDFAPRRSLKNWGATRRLCASASIASTLKGSTASAICRALGASGALPKLNAPGSSLWWPPILLGGWCEVLVGSWKPEMRRRKLIGRWTPLPQPLGKEASPSDAAR